VNIPEFVPWDKNKLITSAILKNNYNMLPNKFWLVVARLEPENNIHMIIDGFLKSRTSMSLIIVGDFTSNSYKKKIYDLISNSSNKILLVGSIYNIEILNMFRQNCFAYIHGHSVGGTNPSLLEAMAMKNIIIAYDNEFNREVGTTCILHFKDSLDLKTKVEMIENDHKKFCEFKCKAHSRVKINYSWKNVVDQYDTLFSTKQQALLSVKQQEL
jgi:rhamnosyltransferase